MQKYYWGSIRIESMTYLYFNMTQTLSSAADYFPPIIATNHRVVAAKRQQRELVAGTIRGSVLFYSSAI